MLQWMDCLLLFNFDIFHLLPILLLFCVATLNIFFRFILLFWWLLARHNLASLHSKTHVVRTKCRSSLIKMKRHILSPIIIKIESLLDL